VADGAVSFYLDRFVKTRVSKLTYGISCGIPYNSSNYEHLQRIHDMYEDFSGLTRIRNSFSVILAKGTAVAENTEFRCPYSRDRKKLAQLNYMSDPILGFYGAKAPSWVDTTDDQMRTLCSVEGDTSRILKKKHIGPRGQYYETSFDIVLIFGPAELKAQYSWTDAHGKEVRGPATVIYTE
jgi:hypothetical protein